jgi:hypothetical protein
MVWPQANLDSSAMVAVAVEEGRLVDESWFGENLRANIAIPKMPTSNIAALISTHGKILFFAESILASLTFAGCSGGTCGAGA